MRSRLAQRARASRKVDAAALRAEVLRPEHIEFQYVIESCIPARSVRYIAHGEVLGFAIERETLFEPIERGTMIRTRAYCVGPPGMAINADLKHFTILWYNGLAQHCDLVAINSLQSKSNREGASEQIPD
jgi:hypothetical protein